MAKYPHLVLFFFCIAMGCVTASNEKKEDMTKTADYSYKLGVGHFEAHQIPLAIRQLTVALERDPKHARAHYLMGYIYMGRRGYTKAIKHFKSSIAAKENFHDAKNALGATYLAMERWRDAEKIFAALLEEPLYGSPELAHNNLGWVHYNLRRYPRAIEHFKMAIYLQPQMCLGHNNLGLVYDKVKKYGMALRQYRKAIELCPHNYAEPHFNLGKLLQQNGDPQAHLHFKRCVDIKPDSNLGERCRQYLN